MNEKDRFAGALSRILELVVLLNDDTTKSLAKEGLTGSRAGSSPGVSHRAKVV